MAAFSVLLIVILTVKFATMENASRVLKAIYSHSSSASTFAVTSILRQMSNVRMETFSPSIVAFCANIPARNTAKNASEVYARNVKRAFI